MKSDHVSIRTLVLSLLAAVVATLVILDWQGKIKHSENKEQLALAEYKVVMIPTDQEKVYRLSPKASFQTAFCQQGYLFIGNDDNPDMQGLLVDYKNRGVKCDDSKVNTDVPKANEETATQNDK